jgi:hypothetical protein
VSMTVPAGGAPVRVLPAEISLGDIIRTPEGMRARVTSREQAPGESTPWLLGYTEQCGVKGYRPFPADQFVTLLHRAADVAVAA